MTERERWKRIAGRLDELIELSPRKRIAALDALPPENEDLRAELERLLREDVAGREGVLDRGVAPLAARVIDDAPGAPSRELTREPRID